MVLIIVGCVVLWCAVCVLLPCVSGPPKSVQDGDSQGLAATIAGAVIGFACIGLCAEHQKNQREEDWRGRLGVNLYPARTDFSIQESWRRNMQQSGVDNQQIPLRVRQEFAEDNGLDVPIK